MARLSVRRRIALLCGLLGTLLVGASAVLAWQWKTPSMVRQRLEQAIGRRVRVGSVGLTWRLQLALRDIEIAGAPPFDSRGFVRIDRAFVRLGGAAGLLSPSDVLIDGVDIDYLATAAGDNLRGLATSRTPSSATPGRGDRSAFPAITVRNGRLRGSLAFPHAPHVAIRAPQVELVRDAKGRSEAAIHGLVVDAEGMASLRAATLKVEMARGEASAVSGTGVALEIPGGGTLSDQLVLEGKTSPAGSTFEVYSKETPNRQVAIAASWNSGSAELSTKLLDLPLRALGALAGGRAVGLENAKAQLQARVTVDRSALRADFDLEGKVMALDLLHPAIDAAPWRNQSVTFSTRGQADLAKGRIDIVEAGLKALGATLRAKGFLENRQAPRGSLTVSTPAHGPLSCAALLFGQPAPVQQALAGLDLEGDLGFQVSLTFDASAWEDLQLEIAIDPVCRVRRDASVLANLLPVLVKPKAEAPPAASKLPLGVFHPDFVPLSQMPTHLPSAFITSEDSKFFHHRGFDTDMIRHALAQDLGNRSFDRGASTITQQLAKNLFLTHRRTLARKLEEAVLTWRLQKLLSKDRVLELYLNVIELGPGIRGVKQAARTYFGKEVGELEPMESAHLAALTPNPHVLARRFRDGQVDEGWQQRLYDLLGMMKRHHRLSAEELAAARASKLELRDLGRDPALQRQN
jgi:hypothetical protein